MASDLLAIGKSGAMAARTALDVTAQNIANASTDGYIRRSVIQQEVSSAGGVGRVGDISLSGVRIERIVRNADMFRQAEVRRTGSDAARANASRTSRTRSSSRASTTPSSASRARSSSWPRTRLIPRCAPRWSRARGR